MIFAGGGMPAGAVFGASDAHAAYPARDPVTPEDIAATVYKALGLDPETTFVRDTLNRPFALSTGTPIRGSLVKSSRLSGHFSPADVMADARWLMTDLR